MKKPVEDYIDAAMEVLDAYLAEKDDKGKPKRENIPKEMKGYISSLGPAILMSGLVPALAFYAAKENDSKKENEDKPDRSQVLRWVYQVLHTKKAVDYPAQSTAKDIFNSIRGQADRHRQMKQDIFNVSVALKLCIRTFELT